MSVLVHIEPLNSSHDRQAFDCGVQVLDRYLREQASQDVKRRVGSCFVAVDHETSAIAAYYTLAATSIPFTELPETETKRLPRYPVLPATLIGRLAVNRSHQGRHLGSALLMDALRRSMDAAPASFALVVDAKDDSAITFYRKCGFIALASRPRSLFLPIATALKLFT